MTSPTRTRATTLLGRLAGSAVAHQAVKYLQLSKLANVYLQRFPKLRSIGESGLQYRVRALGTLLVADEIFNRQIYKKAVEGINISSFCDVGCNVGLFTLYLASRFGTGIRGLLIDANPEVIEEAGWHLRTNCLRSCKAACGLVGFDSSVRHSTFFVNPSHLSSSVSLAGHPRFPPKGRLQAIEVDTIDVDGWWCSEFGDSRVDLLKVDIEGKELDFIRTSADLISRARRIVVEVHKWCVSPSEVDGELRERGFSQRDVIQDDDISTLVVFEVPDRAR